jgi:hypothetical protein
VVFLIRALPGVARKKLTLGVIRQAAKNLHVDATCNEIVADVIDTKPLGPEMLAHNQNLGCVVHC